MSRPGRRRGLPTRLRAGLLLLAALPGLGAASSWIECRFEVRVLAFDGQRFALKTGTFLGADGSVAPSESDCRRSLPEPGGALAEVSAGAQHLVAGALLVGVWSSYSGMGPHGPVESQDWRFQSRGTQADVAQP